VHTVHLDNCQSFLPSDAQLDSFKNNLKFYIKIDIKTLFNVNFNANLKLFLRLSNCASVGEKKFDKIVELCNNRY
jgi:hypothetical protein